MKIISIETSGPVCSVALSEENSIIAELSNSEGNRHDELCAEYVRILLTENNLKIKDIDAIAVSSGPGSFTGLRIGASIAKALCFKENDDDYAPKLIAVPTLPAFVNELLNVFKIESVNNMNVIATIPAQKGYLYFQEFLLSNKDFAAVSEVKLSSIEEFLETDLGDKIICGPKQAIFEDLPALPYLVDYSSELIANLAFKKYIAGEFADAKDFKPMYVQDFQVVKREKVKS